MPDPNAVDTKIQPFSLILLESSVLLSAPLINEWKFQCINKFCIMGKSLCVCIYNVFNVNYVIMLLV